jgi:HSP20 family protein
MYGLTRWTRVEPASLENRINRFFADAFGNGFGGISAAAAWTPPVDILEEHDAIRIIAEVPGVDPENVTISVEDNVLTIHGTKGQTAEEKTERVHRYERSYGAFERTFTLPATVDAGQIKAAHANGVLTITLPKAEKAKARQIQIEVAKR